MKKILSITFVMMLFMVSFSGCQEPEGLPNLIFSIDDINEEGEYSPSWFNTPKAENKENDEIDIHLILDAGMGMKGFTANRDSNYMKMVASLDSIFADMYINRNFNSYKLLNEIYLLQDEENDWEPLREDYVKLLTVDYFHGANIGVDPAIWDTINEGGFNQRNTDYMKIIEFIN
ncbi:MAG: hypothetical protein AB1Z23_09675 [Eubacteriales bacterium]